jgi:hypothetical protein
VNEEAGMRIYKRPNDDGTYTVYRDGTVVSCGLTVAQADALLEELV